MSRGILVSFAPLQFTVRSWVILQAVSLMEPKKEFKTKLLQNIVSVMFVKDTDSMSLPQRLKRFES